MVWETDVLILGAGLTGLSAAAMLGNRAIVVERADRPGGLVRTECFDGYWFDRVVHLLYFADPVTKGRIRALMGDDLTPCVPSAWVECSGGTVHFPFQMHLGGLDRDTTSRCVRDFTKASFGPEQPAPTNFEERLLQTFGRAMCETFFFPYNRKMWKRPLNTLAPSGFQWNMARPDFNQVMQGVLRPGEDSHNYNSEGWYPRPARGFPVRGMEVLSYVLARQAADVRLQHSVEAIDLETRTVTVRHGEKVEQFRFREACCASLPLPQVVAMCRQAPEELRLACGTLTCNRVLSAAFSIRGPRPSSRGHWRYYTDESLIFTRLIYLHEFDPDCAPEDGWALLAEITEPAEGPLPDPRVVLEHARADILRAGALPEDCRIIDQHLMIADPAYVVFTTENQAVIERARQFLEDHGIMPLGRYGRWEYSSMAQVMRDGFGWGEQMSARLSEHAGGRGVRAT